MKSKSITPSPKKEIRVRKMVECADTAEADGKGVRGCGKAFAVFGTFSVQFTHSCQKIEGQDL